MAINGYNSWIFRVFEPPAHVGHKIPDSSVPWLHTGNLLEVEFSVQSQFQGHEISPAKICKNVQKYAKMVWKWGGNNGPPSILQMGKAGKPDSRRSWAIEKPLEDSPTPKIGYLWPEIPNMYICTYIIYIYIYI